MKKPIILFILILLFLNFSLHANAEMNSFATAREYVPYTDVKENDWYYKYVKLCYETNLMTGTGDNLFCPADIVSIQQGIAIIARLHQIYNGNPKIEEMSPEKNRLGFSLLRVLLKMGPFE